MKNKLFLILYFILCHASIVHAQRQLLTGKVLSTTNPLKGVLVVNVNAEKEARTDKHGIFKIKAQRGDTLVVTDPGITAVRLVISDASFYNPPIIEAVLNEAYELEAAVVEKNNRLTAEALRIVPKGTAKYTDRERKAQTGARIGPRTDSIIGGGVVINGDAIINAFNGKRKALKKAMEVERTEQHLEILSASYDEETLKEKYSIPTEYAKGFLHYAVGDERLVAAMKQHNAALVETLISELALTYLELLKDEE